MKAGGSDLKFLFSREGVDEDFQAAMFRIGIKSVRQFGLLVSSSDELKAVLKKDMGIDGEVGLLERSVSP